MSVRLSVLVRGRLGSVFSKAYVHCSARLRRRIHEGSNPASDNKNL